MRNVIKAALFTLILALAAPVAAQDFEAGREAYKRGDYAAALSEWLSLAEQGNAQAQHQLGYMYLRGRGVARDDIQAHMWWSLAASQGYKASTIARTLVAGRMAPAQIAEAQKLAREWQPK